MASCNSFYCSKRNKMKKRHLFLSVAQLSSKTNKTVGSYNQKSINTNIILSFKQCKIRQNETWLEWQGWAPPSGHSISPPPPNLWCNCQLCSTQTLHNKHSKLDQLCNGSLLQVIVRSFAYMCWLGCDKRKNM